jgi:hypothetical protein
VETIATFLVAIVLLLIAASFADSYLNAFAPLLIRSGASRAIRAVARGAVSFVGFLVSLLVRRRPRRLRSLPAARTYRRTRATNHHDRLF